MQESCYDDARGPGGRAVGRRSVCLCFTKPQIFLLPPPSLHLLSSASNIRVSFHLSLPSINTNSAFIQAWSLAAHNLLDSLTCVISAVKVFTRLSTKQPGKRDLRLSFSIVLALYSAEHATNTKPPKHVGKHSRINSYLAGPTLQSSSQEGTRTSHSTVYAIRCRRGPFRQTTRH